MKKIQDYLHYYKEVPIIIVEKSVTTEGEIIKTPHYLEGIDWVANKPIAERVSWKWEEIRPILKPLSSFGEEEFKHMAKILLNTDKILFATVDNMWIASSDEDKEEDELEMNEVERIYYAEECNYDNVVSMDIKGERSFAWGCSDDCRFFMGHDKQAIIFNEMIKMHFDVFGLIKEGLAYNKYHLKNGSDN